MPKLYAHYSRFNGHWLWPDFSPREVACRHCGELYLDPVAMDALQALRRAWGKAIVINSGHRCAVHNAAVGGLATSRHLTIAFDCACLAADQDSFANLALAVGFTGIGWYARQNFMHLDMRPVQSFWWGKA